MKEHTTKTEYLVQFQTKFGNWSAGEPFKSRSEAETFLAHIIDADDDTEISFIQARIVSSIVTKTTETILLKQIEI